MEEIIRVFKELRLLKEFQRYQLGGGCECGGGGVLVLAASCLLLAVAFRKIQPDIQDTEYCKLYWPSKLTFSQHLFPATNTSSCVGNNEEI